MRPGEKSYEELPTGENPEPTVHPHIMKVHEDLIPWAELEAKITMLEMALNVNDYRALRRIMQ